MSSTPFRQRLALQVIAKFNQSKAAGNQGFTLIELLVVIVILGVLGAAGYGAYINQIGRANGATAQNTATALAKNCSALLVTETTAAANTAWQLNRTDSVDSTQVTVGTTTCGAPMSVSVTAGRTQPRTSVASVTSEGAVTPGIVTP